MPAIVEQQDKKIFEKLIKRFPLRPIHNEKENELAAEICDEFTARIDKLCQAEQDYLEVLSDLITKFESRWDSEDLNMSPSELIKYLMEENALNQSDLIEDFGSASRISEFLSGKRGLSVEQAKKLSQRFKLSLDALLA